MEQTRHQLHQENLEHARWRVSYFRSIYQSRVMLASHSLDDKVAEEKKNLFAKRLAVAEEELLRLEAHDVMDTIMTAIVGEQEQQVA